MGLGEGIEQKRSHYYRLYRYWKGGKWTGQTVAIEWPMGEMCVVILTNHAKSLEGFDNWKFEHIFIFVLEVQIHPNIVNY